MRVKNTVVSRQAEHELPESLSSSLPSVVFITNWRCEHFGERLHHFFNISDLFRIGKQTGISDQ